MTRCSRQRRTASTIAGRISPASSGISARASTAWPCAAALGLEQVAELVEGAPRCARSRAHALVSGLVALMVRMKSRGSPVRSSKPLKASKGLDRITPPKSKKAARIGTAGIVG